MAEIKTYPLTKHLRSEPTMHTMQYKKGKVVRSGKGLSFWFRPLSNSILEVPLDDQALQVIFHGRSSDFQDVTVQGVITYRVKDPEVISNRIDFAIDLETGLYVKAPLEQMGNLLSQLSQQFVLDYLASTSLHEIFQNGLAQTRAQITKGLDAEGRLVDLGIEIVAVRVSAIKPSSEVEKALQTPARESLQQRADEAMFSRRAQAVQKERAIEENELQNKIELAKRQELLVAQEGQNAQRKATEKAAAQKIEAQGEVERAQIKSVSQAKASKIETEAEAEKRRVLASADANTIDLVENAKVIAERERMAMFKDMDGVTMMGIAAQELAGKLHTIEHVNISPDMLTPILANFIETKTKEIKGS